MISDVLFSHKPAKFQAKKTISLKIKVRVINKIWIMKVEKSHTISKMIAFLQTS